MSYQERDKHILDYGMVELPGIKPYPGGGMFRGPYVTSDRYIACIGAAQTFGCFCPEPFPRLLRQQLDIETLNLGYGGASPTFHLSNPALMDYINRACLVVVQVFSGRSQSNSRFQITEHGMEGIRTADGVRMTAEEFYTSLLSESQDEVSEIVTETRENYVQAMTRLLQAIHSPKILFWFSIRTPSYTEAYELPIWKLWGNFPQFVNHPMIERLQTQCDAYVECVSQVGLPQRLYDRAGNPTTVTHCYNLLTHEPITETHNRYYPSPEMHVEAANRLAPVCQRLWVGTGRR